MHLFERTVMRTALGGRCWYTRLIRSSAYMHVQHDIRHVTSSRRDGGVGRGENISMKCDGDRLCTDMHTYVHTYTHTIHMQIRYTHPYIQYIHASTLARGWVGHWSASSKRSRSGWCSRASRWAFSSAGSCSNGPCEPNNAITTLRCTSV